MTMPAYRTIVISGNFLPATPGRRCRGVSPFSIPSSIGPASARASPFTNDMHFEVVEETNKR
jgi:hypothetical protein